MRAPHPTHVLVLLTPLLAQVVACAKNAADITSNKIYADDGQVIAAEGTSTFAVVGNTRDPIPMLDGSSGKKGDVADVTGDIVSDISAQVEAGGPDFLVLMGDQVRTGSTGEYNSFNRDFRRLIDGGPAPDTTTKRVGVIPVPGNREAAMDKRFGAWEAAFPGVGAEIGYNRVGSWYYFDVESKGTTWRLMVLDTGKKRLGSRWNEQRNWIPRALEGDYDTLIIFMHDSLFDLGGAKVGMNPGGSPGELIDIVEEKAPRLDALRAVFFAGSHTNQVLMPDGPFGALYLGAGGGGAPAEDLMRWGPADAAGRNEDIQLEPIFDLALLSALDGYAQRGQVPEVTLDQAKAKNSYEGFTGTFNASQFPVYGWWQVDLDGPAASVAFRLRSPDAVFRYIYRAAWTDENGWRAIKM